MSHGSAFVAAGKAVIAALAERPGMAGWNVRYDGPRTPDDLLNPIGQRMAVWVDPEGGSDYQIVTMPTGYEERSTVTFVFEFLEPMSLASQVSVDEAVAEAAGELLDMLADDPRLAGTPPVDGWDLTWAQVESSTRVGGPLTDKPGYGRRLEVGVEVVAMRC